MGAISKSVHSAEYQCLLSLLRQAREAAQLSQRALARKLEKPPSYVHKCEVGDRQLNVVELRVWCMALEIPWLEFLQRFEDGLADKDA